MPAALVIEDYCFSTEKLKQYWDAVDEFEGMQYQRVQVMIQLESGEQKSAWVYEMKNALNCCVGF
ncbi:gamma-glutamylcyclotransferase [Acinetobacter johnsonii]|nr:gamma-glutamylcyclotransferase [Acinetobacter johnsonii]